MDPSRTGNNMSSHHLRLWIKKNFTAKKQYQLRPCRQSLRYTASQRLTAYQICTAKWQKNWDASPISHFGLHLLRSNQLEICISLHLEISYSERCLYHILNYRIYSKSGHLSVYQFISRCSTLCAVSNDWLQEIHPPPDLSMHDMIYKHALAVSRSAAIQYHKPACRTR